MEERIKEKVIRKKNKYNRILIILMTLLGGLLIFASSYKHPLLFTFAWRNIIAIEILIILGFYWMGKTFLFAIAEREVEEEEIVTYVKDKLEAKEKIEVKSEYEKTCEFIFDLQKRGKFFAEFLNDQESQVRIVYKFNGEDKEILCECISPSEFYEKYSFVEDE